MPPSARDVLLKFAPMIYGPTLLFALGQGALIPMLPVIASGMGANLALSGLVAAMIVVGQLIGNLPAGMLVARVGERYTMISAGVLGVVSLCGVIVAPNVQVLGLCVFLLGFCASAYGLARHAFMTTRVPVQFRARALSVLAGTFRLGAFVGPFLAAALIFCFNAQIAPAFGFAVLLTLSVVLVAVGPDPANTILPVPRVEPLAESVRQDLGDTADTGEAVTSEVHAPAQAAQLGVFATMWKFRGVLLRLGLAGAAMNAVRAARQIVLPLWGLSLGLDASTISLVVGVVGAIDFSMFYFSGQVMDRYGRLWAALPAMLLLGSGFVGLSLTHQSEHATMWFALCAAVIGLGNGLSSGTLLTIGADIAPTVQPASFLSSWRTVIDAGGALAPLMFSAIAAFATISVATAAIGVIGFLGVWGFWKWMPREPRETLVG